MLEFEKFQIIAEEAKAISIIKLYHAAALRRTGLNDKTEQSDIPIELYKSSIKREVIIKMITEKMYGNIDKESYLNHCELQIEKLMQFKWVGNPALADFLKKLKVDLDKK